MTLEDAPGRPAYSDAEAFVRREWLRVLRRKHGGLPVTPDDLSDLPTVAERMADVLGVPPLAEVPHRPLPFTSGGGAGPYALAGVYEHLADDIQADMPAGLAPPEAGVLAQCLIRLMPTGRANALALLRDERGVPLDRPVLLLNYGLVDVLFTLADCLAVEQLTGDLAHLRADGAPFFGRAYDLLVRQPPRDVGGPDPSDRDVYARWAAVSAPLAARVFLFIAWHELAHVVYGDVAADDRRFVVHEASVAAPPDRERRADRFAAAAAIRSSSSPQTRWANLAPVYLFFRWSDAVGRVRPDQIDRFHPPAAERAALLEEELLRASRGRSSRLRSGFRWIDSRLATWAGALTEDVQ